MNVTLATVPSTKDIPSIGAVVGAVVAVVGVLLLIGIAIVVVIAIVLRYDPAHTVSVNYCFTASIPINAQFLFLWLYG